MEHEIKLLKALFWGKKQKQIFDQVSEKHFEDQHLCYIYKKSREVWEKHEAVDVFSVFEHIRASSEVAYTKLEESDILNILLTKDKHEIINTDMVVRSLVEKKAGIEALKKLDEIREVIETYGIGDIDEKVGDLSRLIPRNCKDVKSRVEFEDEMLGLIYNDDLPGIPTHFKGINRLLSKFENGGYKSGVYCVGAASKTGKSCWIRNVTIGQAQRHTARVKYYNFELDKNEQNARNISLVTSLPIVDIINPQKSDETISEIKRGIKILAELHQERWFMIDNNPPSSMDDLKADIRTMNANYGTKVFVIDTFNKVVNQNDASYKGYKDNAQGFERLYKELDITIILICQLVVDSKQWYPGENGKMRCRNVDPRTVKPNCQDSNDTKELHKTCSSFLVMWWDSQDNSVVYVAEDAHRYGTRGLVAFKFDPTREYYEEIDSVGGTWE